MKRISRHGYDYNVHLTDTEWGPEPGSPVGPFADFQGAEEFARHKVYLMGETAIATICRDDDPACEAIETITYKDTVCGCGCGQEVSVKGGFAGTECKRLALL